MLNRGTRSDGAPVAVPRVPSRFPRRHRPGRTLQCPRRCRRIRSYHLWRRRMGYGEQSNGNPYTLAPESAATENGAPSGHRLARRSPARDHTETTARTTRAHTHTIARWVFVDIATRERHRSCCLQRRTDDHLGSPPRPDPPTTFRRSCCNLLFVRSSIIVVATFRFAAHPWAGRPRLMA